MKKILSVILCLIIVVASGFLLVGCKNVDTNVNLYENDLVSEVVHDKATPDIWTVKLKEKTNVDTLVLEEKTDTVTSFGVYGKEDDGTYILIYKQNRIDEYRVCALEEIVTDELRIEIFAKTGKTNLKNIKVYNSQEKMRSTSFRVTDYLMTTNRKLKNNENKAEFYNHLSVVDDLIMFGDIYMDNAGAIVFSEGKEDFAEDVAVLKSLREKAANPDMKIVVNIDLKKHVDKTLKDSKQNTAVQKWIKANLATIATNISNLLLEFNLDGVDLDWDYPKTNTQWNYYSKLILELNKLLEQKNKFVTVAVFPWECKLSKKARAAVEYVNLQAYDLYDEKGEHASQYQTAKLAVQTFLQKSKFEPQKVMLGLPFYGRTTNKSSLIFDPSEYFKSNQEIDKWINKIYNYRFIDGNMTRYSDIYFNGYGMICDKTTYAISCGLGGVSIYGMAYDVPANWDLSLHNAVRQTIAKRVQVVQE